ncbi:MAG: tetratricopeptide repeat protein [Prevotella sp.]|nr:tetratricopeptide repeat protein [Prevotella sp.]
MKSEMATYDKSLERVTKAIVSGNCGRAIHEMEVYLTAWPEPQTQDKLSCLRSDYDRMSDYWRSGGKDAEREVVYQQLLQQVYVLYANVRHYHRMKASPYQYSLYTRVRQNRKDWSLTAIRQEMEGFVSDVAMLQLEPEHTRKEKSESLYRQHQQQMSQLFEYVLTSRQWTDSVGQYVADMMTAPTIDTNDQQLIVSAVTLSLLNQFDMAKFRMLVSVYRLSEDEAVRQRALVGWVLSMDRDYTLVYPEQEALVHELVQSEDVCKELTELQMQLIYCLNVEKDTDTIKKEILPDLIKGSNLKMTRLGLVEQQEDTLEDILNTGAAEERMERLETTYQRMMNMQKQGADIYFGGFSGMKRFPFFYDISNWLVPFFIQHPDIQQYVSRMDGNRFIQQLMSGNLFCNSDRYSFIMAFQSVLDQLPESIRQMVQRGEASMSEMGLSTDEAQTTVFLRRSYLMDLYRFFRLFPHRSELTTPFDTNSSETEHWAFFSSRQFKGTSLDKYKWDIAKMLRKHHYTEMANRVVDSMPKEMQGVEYYLWKKEYMKAFELAPQDERVLAGVARLSYEKGQYREAVKYYDELLRLYPEKDRYLLNKAISLIGAEAYEEALKLLYQLTYEQPDNVHASKALAWALTCCGKMDQAERYYVEIMAHEEPTADNYHNYGCCLWLQGRIDDAVEAFRKYVELADIQDTSLFLFEADWLRKRGITDVDINMMEALVQTEYRPHEP